MSVICQNFVQNAWKKDLCSNCFKSIGDHESPQIVQNGENPKTGSSEHLNGNCVSRVQSNIYVSRNEPTPHTTWKTLISERNNKNSQPFKLENGFQGRLLTINKALNGTDKQSKSEIVNEKPKLQTNGITVKTLNGNVKKQVSKQEILYQSKKNVSDGIKESPRENCNNQNRILSPDKKQNFGHSEYKSPEPIKSSDNRHVQSKPGKNKSEEITQDVSLHSILKKTTSTPIDSGQNRRNSNVGFKDEEPLVIGYGGRDFSPEELEWEMASSDGEVENGSDSLDETEDDIVFSKMTKQNTEFNSDNFNLLQNNEDEITPKNSEVKVSKQNKSQISKLNIDQKTNGILNIESKQKASLNSKNTRSEANQQTKTRYKNDRFNSTADTGVNNKEQKEQHTCTTDKTEVDNCKSAKQTSEEKKVELAPVESKSANDSSINVAVSSENKSLEAKKCEVAVAERRRAEVSSEDVKNNSEFINEAASLSSSVDAPEMIESEKSAEAVMFSDGMRDEKSSEDGCNEWQDEDAVPGQILQAINTSLTNRHKMRENSELSNVLENGDINSSKENEDFENEANKISLSINDGKSDVCDEIQENNNEMDDESENSLNVIPRDSFLHGTISKPSAIYGPASDFFVSRSDSSSSSSSDEQSKKQISLSINVRVNGEDSQKSADELDSENEIDSNIPKENTKGKIRNANNKGKPEIPAKPVKPLSLDTYKQYDRNHSPKSTVKDDFNPSAKFESISEISYYSPVPDRSTTINLVDAYAESNIYQEVNEKDFEKIQDSELVTKAPARESRLAALAIELEQVRHTNISTKRQAPAPPKVPDPPQEDPPSCAGRISPATDAPNSFSTFRGESMGFSSSSSTTSTSSQDTETGYASWNLHGDVEDHPKYSKSKTSFLLTQYSKCKMLAMGYAEDSAKARKRFSIKKLLKIGKETEPPAAFDPNCPNPKAWKYSDHFERPRAKLEIIHPMDLENKSVTVNPGFDSLHSSSLSTFSPNSNDDSSFRNSVTSVSSDYGSFYSDTLSPAQEGKQEANYEYIQPHQSIAEENEESCSKAGTSSSTSPTPSRSSTASQASTVTSGSSKNGAVPHRPPKPPPPPRAHSLLPGNKVIRNSDGTFKIPHINGDTSSSDEVTVTLAKPQAPKRQCKSAILRSDNKSPDEERDVEIQQDAFSSAQEPLSILEFIKQDASQEESNIKNTSSIQIIQTENDNKQNDHSLSISSEGVYDNLETSKESSLQTSITIKTGVSNQNEKFSKSMLSRNKHPPLTKAPARPPPIYSKPQTGSFPKNIHPWKTLEDSYLALTSCNRELLIKLVNQALKKRKIKESKLSKLQFHWNDFEIDASQPSSVFAFGEKIAYHATMPQYPEYFLTLVISIQHQSQLQEYTEIKYPMFGKFSDYIPGELLDNSEDRELESMPATILVLDRSNILTIECFSENLPMTLTEENEKELCFITLQLIQSLKSLQVQGIESIDTSCQNLLLVKTKNDKYYTLVFLYDICYEENDYSSDSCKISLCQYTLMLLFQMLKIQTIDDPVLASKFSSNMSRKIFESAFSLLSEEKAVSLSQTKTLFECYLWGVTKVLESLQNSDDCDSILHRWLDIERSSCIKCIVNDESNDINIQNEYYSQFLMRTTVRSIREVASYL